jgi:hypothetical protein
VIQIGTDSIAFEKRVYNQPALVEAVAGDGILCFFIAPVKGKLYVVYRRITENLILPVGAFARVSGNGRSSDDPSK